MTDHIFAVMDAQCALCAKGAAWIARNDKPDRFRIIPIASPLGQSLAVRHGLDPDDPASWLVLEGADAFTGMDAMIHTAHHLGGKWRLLNFLKLLPKPLRCDLQNRSPEPVSPVWQRGSLPAPRPGSQKKAGPMTLYRTHLGAAFETLPAPVQTFHDAGGTWTGTANIKRGKHPLARLVARQIGFPPPGKNVPLTVSVAQTENAELWTRDFGGHILASRQEIDGDHIAETFGQTRVALKLEATEPRLWVTPAKWHAFGVPMPKHLLPGGDTYESAKGDRFQFNVTVTAPIVGLIASYEGQLKQMETENA